MKKGIFIAFIFLVLSATSFSQNFTYKFCLVQKDANTIAFEFTVCNNSATGLNTYDFIFNWPGVSNVTVDNGLNVIKNGNNGVVELEKQSWAQALAPGCNNKFTVRMNYVFGMFPPTSGTLNGDSIPGITCYTPPSFENFSCEKNFNANCFIHTESELKIGEGTVRAWNSTRDVYIPSNRKGWAISMAVAHTMFNNLMGFDCMTVNEYFATAMQESSCGCDPGVTAPAWVANPYNIQPLNYCADLTHGVAAGFFQEEYGTGWVELEKDIPCFIPTADFDKFIIGSKFETQAIGKVYHDFNNISYWQYIKCWNPIGFLKNAKDPYATEKLIALGYNRGLNSGEIGNVLTTNRAAAITATNILPYLNPGGVGWVYAEQISRISAVLDNNMSAVDPADPIASSVPYPGIHSFRDFYDSPILWSDISDYIDAIAPMYAGVGLNATAFKNKIQNVFNAINGGGSVSFRFGIAPVIDAIVLNLPAFDPKYGLGGMYVNSGGSSCKYPTASLSKSDTVCMGTPLTLTVKLTGTPPWTFSYQNPKGTIVMLTGISTSPYVFTVPDTGVYNLISVNDITNTPGEAICNPVIKAYFNGGAVAHLVTTSTTPCGARTVQIKFTGTGPFDIEYTIDGAAQTPVKGIMQNPYTLIPANAPIGTYVLTRLKANGCDMHLHDTAIVYPLSTPSIAIKGNNAICSGESTKLTTQSTSIISSYSWLPSTGLDSTTNSSTIASPPVTTTYTLTVTDVNGCTAKDSIKITVNPRPLLTVSADTSICLHTKITLNANGGSTYNWSPAVGLSSTTDAAVIASPLSTTNYTVTVTALNGCSAVDSVMILVNPLPGLTVSSDTSICLNDKTVLIATGADTYSWTPAIGLDTSMGASVIASPTATTQYVVTGISVNGCNATDTVTITVVPCNFITTTVTSGNICEGDCFTIKSTVLGGTGPFTFNWQPGGFTGDSITVCPTTTTTYSLVVTDQWGGIGKATSSIQVTPKPVIQVNNPSMCMGDTAILTASGGTSYSWSTGSTGTSISVSPQTTTTYTVTGKSLEGCMDSTVATVTIKPKPVVQFGPDTASCAPLVVHFINLSTGMVANTTCTWDFGNSTSSQRCEPGSITYTTPGTYSISLTINNGGCSATLTNKSITVYPSPRALFTADPQNSDLYDPTITFLNESTNMNKSILFFGDGTGDSSNVELLKHTYKKEGVYPVCLKVSNATNCVDHYCTEVIIHPGWSFYIPNAFTPGDYSVNPTFNGKGENISDFHLLIFNRWGNLLFESNSLSDGWDGRINRGSEMAQQDVYVYKVSFRDVFNKKHEYIGSVTLLKY